MNKPLIANGTGHSASFEVAFLFGVHAAEEEGVLDEGQILALGKVEYDLASRTLLLDKHEFVNGYVSGFFAHLNGVV